MKKAFQLSIILVSGLLLSACGKMPVQKGANDNAFKNLPKVDLSIRELYDAGISFECIIAREGNTIGLYSKDQKIRLDGMPYIFERENPVSLATSTQILVDDKIYISTEKESKEMTGDDFVKLFGLNLGGQEGEIKAIDVLIKNFESANSTYECKDAELEDNIFVPIEKNTIASSTEEN